MHAQSCLSVTPWTVAYQVLMTIEFSRQEYWSGLPFPPTEDTPDPGIEPTSLASSALAGRLFATGPPGKHSGEYSGLKAWSPQSGRPGVGF